MAVSCGFLFAGFPAESQPSIPLASFPFQNGGNGGGFDNFCTDYGSLPSGFSPNLISLPVNLADGFWWPNVLLTDSINPPLP